LESGFKATAAQKPVMATRNPADESASEDVAESESAAENRNQGEAARSRRERAADDIERLFGSVPHVRVSRLSDGEVRGATRD
jgi:hypothetical protein